MRVQLQLLSPFEQALASAMPFAMGEDARQGSRPESVFCRGAGRLVLRAPALAGCQMFDTSRTRRRFVPGSSTHLAYSPVRWRLEVEMQVPERRKSTMPTESSCLNRIDAFADVSAHLEARIGQCVMSLDQVASLTVGSTIQLDRNAGDTLELRVGNVVMGLCEVVVIEDRLAIRIAELAL